ncbi:hypothetical protein CIRG_09934 [Coccidioides immitis RMSCC 2394]|uniref:Uncharacterized protein n=1 Tax=Coccidioides immitis RMSCC 2394 TaxID=404692 RepID=A0A0J6YTD9_COCIT|nr:hypothetical protein CIRG_09934 [Coccidioides immitis RMSCC 2394]
MKDWILGLWSGTPGLASQPWQPPGSVRLPLARREKSGWSSCRICKGHREGHGEESPPSRRTSAAAAWDLIRVTNGQITVLFQGSLPETPRRTGSRGTSRACLPARMPDAC